MDKKKVVGKAKKMKRTEELARKKAVEGVIKLANAKKDHLVDIPIFTQFEKNGISVHLESGTGDILSFSHKQFIQDLLKINMEGPYGAEWSREEKVKRREMVGANARYIFVKLDESDRFEVNPHGDVLQTRMKTSPFLWKGSGNPVVAFVQYRFIVEEDFPVLYVYELQLEGHVQGKGLGKFLMQLLELIACKNNMKAVMLTVQRRNIVAMDFYMRKLSYKISSVSPSRVNLVLGADSTYEILCKSFDSCAKCILEDGIDCC